MKALLSYGLALVGVGMLVIAMAPAFAGTKYVHAKLMLLNLLRTQPNRAEIACRTVKGTFMEAIGGGFKTWLMTKMRDPAIVAQMVRAGYDAAAGQVAARYKQLLTKAKLGAGMVVGGLAMSVMAEGKTRPLLVILALLCGGGFLFLLHRKSVVERELMLARAEILPDVERAIIDGRFAA